jgi:parvulin-like peptidyl-prolyl isomerase
VRAGQLPQELFDAAEALKVGEVSRPTHSSFGIHIFKALSPIEHVQPSFDEVKGQLAVKLRHDAQARLNERLRGEIRVVRHTEKLDAGEPK